MIIAQIRGGLGNQMFQYACGRHLAFKRDTELKLDLSWYQRNKARKYCLDSLQIKASIALESDFQSQPEIIEVHQRFFHYDPEILQSSENTHLIGFWQTDKYFRNIQGIIKHEFRLKPQTTFGPIHLEALIRNTCSVAIHFRRGDYAGVEKNRFGLCTHSYYQKAIKSLSCHASNLHFFIFSDDIEWVKKNFSFDHPVTFVSEFTHTDLADFRLMTLCQHHIIANSTFSWWGAWLSSRSGKTVYAPNPWFVNLPHNTVDLIPENWIKISSTLEG